MPRSIKNERTAIDLFSGAGGLTVGLKSAGFRILVGIENDETAAETYRMNHPDVFLLAKDIRRINPIEVLKALGLEEGELDLLAGCPPCQGFSTLRTNNKCISVKDKRNDLIFQYLKWVKAFSPKSIMMENVPALAKDFRMRRLLKELKKVGYAVGDETISIVNAEDFGVPQRRKRMILLAAKDGKIDQPKPARFKKYVKHVLRGLPKPGHSGDVLHDFPVNTTERIGNLIKLIPKNGGSRRDLPKRYWLDCHKRYPGGFVDVYGRMAWDEVAPTITGGCTNPSKGRFIHPQQNRPITLREAALLQTFPKKYKFSLKKGKDFVALMIGNALPPEMIRRHAKVIFAHLNKSS